MSGWLKAGLIFAAVNVVLNLINIIQIPFLGCCTLLLSLAAYVGAGVLASSYMPPPRQPSQAAGQGALAAVVAAAIGGIVGIIVGAVQTTAVRPQLIQQLPPEALEALRDSGISPDMLFSPVAAFGIGFVCCSIGVLVAAALGAIGAAVYASSRPNGTGSTPVISSAV
jgi:hypothetical protein